MAVSEESITEATMLLVIQLITSLLTLATASPIYRRETHSAKVEKPGLLQQELVYGPDFIAVDVGIGSNNQSLLLKLDFNTADIWVNSDLNDFCLAYYSIPNFVNGTENAAMWNSFNENLRGNFTNQINEFHNEKINALETIAPTATSKLSSQLNKIQTEFQSLLSEQHVSVTKEISNFLGTASLPTDSVIETFLSGVHSAAENLGKEITSNAYNFEREATSMGELLGVKVTTVSDHVLTLVTGPAQDFASEVTSKGGEFATKVTSEFGDVTSDVVSGWNKFTTDITSKGGEFATKVTSGYGDVTSNVVSGWDKFTSNFVGIFKKASPTTRSSVAHTSTYNFIPQETQISNGSVIFDNSTIGIDDFLYQVSHDCSLFGVFNDSSSNSFQSSSEIFFSNDSYGAFGHLGNDTIHMGGVSVDNVTFGVADSSLSNIGIVGVGKSNRNSSFKSFPEILVDRGIINKALYSIDFNYHAPSILFGAIDYAKFGGNITLLPLLNETEGAIAVTLSGLGITSFDNETSEFVQGKAPAILDPTSNSVLFPREVLSSFVSSLNKTFDVSYNSSFGRYVLHRDDDVYIDDYALNFDFQGYNFSVDLDNFVIPVLEDETIFINGSTLSNGAGANSSFYFSKFDEPYPVDDIPVHVNNASFIDEKTFILNIIESDDGSVVLGLDLLDSTVLVIDLESLQVGFTRSHSSDSQIVVIENKIPFSSKAPKYSDYYGSNNVTSLTAVHV
ncbi:Aspartic proteinase 3 [Pichia kudriavzevii]|uniref:Aspartic proteinase 3 n=1 Tax=Pichia kudriavzevii TaxID=4909 RepID=A0A1V2LTV7_PICKU|nr:Aspartic proteinase 3 [Pichia kudriavzevii]